MTVRPQICDSRMTPPHCGAVASWRMGPEEAVRERRKCSDEGRQCYGDDAFFLIHFHLRAELANEAAEELDMAFIWAAFHQPGQNRPIHHHGENRAAIRMRQKFKVEACAG